MKVASKLVRRSVEQNVSEDEKSISRQIRLADEFIEANGWIPGETYVDDGVSGAEFENRPGLQEMLRHKEEFQILVVANRSRLSRDMTDANWIIKKLDVAGIDVISYQTGKSLIPETPEDELKGNIEGYSDKKERMKAAENVYESHFDKFTRGLPVGGYKYAYRINTERDEDGNVVSRKWVKVPEEEAGVLRAYELRASGWGYKRIAKQLSHEGYPKPKYNWKDESKPPPKGWSPASVRSMLRNPIYIGIFRWNRSKKRDKWGRVRQRRRPESEWQEIQLPQLRIVPQDLWDRVQTINTDVAGKWLRFSDGRIVGRPPKYPTNNILSGMATCGQCGGPLIVATSARKSGRVSEYVCGNRRKNGSCENKLRIAVDVLNEAVLSGIEEHALTPEAVETVIRLSERNEATDKETVLVAEREANAKKLKNLVSQVEEGSTSVMARIKELEKRQQAIADELDGLKPMPRPEHKVVEDRLGEWRRLLRSSPTQAKAVHQRLIDGRIYFLPLWEIDEVQADVVAKGYEFQARTRYSNLFRGVAVPAPEFLKEGDLRGTGHIRPEDTHDADYGELLEKAERRVKRMASPTGVEPVLPP